MKARFIKYNEIPAVEARKGIHVKPLSWIGLLR